MIDTMIRAVLFDVGGVLVRAHSPLRQAYWEQRCGIAPGELALAFYVNPVADQAMLGRGSEADVWAAFQDHYGLSASETHTLQTDWEQARTIDVELLAFIRSLRPQMKTGIISDAFREARPKLSAALDPSLFDVILLSAEEGLRKPHPEIFRRVLERLDVAPGEAIFVDDLPGNVEGARRVGLHAVHCRETRQTIAEIQAILHTPKPVDG